MHVYALGGRQLAWHCQHTAAGSFISGLGQLVSDQNPKSSHEPQVVPIRKSDYQPRVSSKETSSIIASGNAMLGDGSVACIACKALEVHCSSG